MRALRYAPMGGFHRFYIQSDHGSVRDWLRLEFGVPVDQDGGPGRWFMIENVAFIVLAEEDAVMTRLRWC